MYAEWLAYGSDTKRIVTSFVEGINQFQALIDSRPELRPIEFQELDYEPAMWAPEDVVRIRSHGLIGNLRREVARARVLRDFGPDAEAVRSPLSPSWELTTPEGLDMESIPDEILDVYNLATQGVSFEDETSASDLGSLVRDLYSATHIGSNNWAVSPTRTSTGRPILANDPHRTQSVPSLRYITHINAPGFSVIGAGEPSLPGISIGHNGKIAFGLTIFSMDQEDLYIYETNPENPDEYRYEDRWEPLEVLSEDIAVREGASEAVEMKFSRHGPIVYEDSGNNRAFAVRSTWLEPGSSAYLGSIEYMRAENWDEFLAAMNRWQSPSENQVYADTNGNIGWKPGGLAPIRPNWDGLLPVPGNGQYEWDGFWTMDKMPVAFNPDQGWVATANEMNYPPDYPYEDYKLAFDGWASPVRFQRIKEVLEGNDNVTLQDMLALQTDHLSIPARRVIALLGDLSSDVDEVNQAIELLSSWDFVESIDSAAAALWEVWSSRHLRAAVVAELLPPEAAEVVGNGDLDYILNLLEEPDSRLGDNPQDARDQLLLSSLESALEEVQELLGEDMSAWEWGMLHHSALEHPLSPVVDESLRADMNVGPLPRGGSGDTVGNTSYRASDFRQSGGSSWRMVIDVGNWDDSLAMNSPGQSSDPGNAHYRDLFEPWATDQAFPLLYSRELIEAVVESRILLTPKT